MKYLFDIGHPAEVHTFKNVIKYLQVKGHEVLVTARDKEMTLYLLDHYRIPYVSTGKTLSSKVGKLWAFLRNDLKILKAAIFFKPDLIINFFSPFAAHVGKLLSIPVLGFHDTEHADLTIKLAKPFTDTIVVPSCYKRKYPGKSVIKFNGNFELAYLHPNYFKPDPSILDLLGVEKEKKFVLLRFVTHTSMHDKGHKGFSDEEKIRIVEKLSKQTKVFISSEVPLPDKLKKYELKTPPERIHDVINYASLLYGESATMSSEAAVLGTPAIFVDEKRIGYTNEEESKYGLVFNFFSTSGEKISAEKKGIELLETDTTEWPKKKERLIKESIDVTAFMTWFIEEYPKSRDIAVADPEYQFRFR